MNLFDKPRLKSRDAHHVNIEDQDSDATQGHNEALALVNVHKAKGAAPPGNGEASVEAEETEQSKKKEDLCRAKELVQLHHEIKARHLNGKVDEELRRAREDVQRVLIELA